MKIYTPGVKISECNYPPLNTNVMLFAKSVLPLLCEWGSLVCTFSFSLLPPVCESGSTKIYIV